ncbi:MAG TPA: ribosomal protein S18-alanine N-acetyltransferase [Gemmatimonadaceae bacterium]
MIRRAVGTDLPAISAIERASFSDPWTVDSFASAMSLAHVHFLVVEEVSEAAGTPVARRPGVLPVVGYVVALLAADQGEIADIAVDVAARRRGVGRLLLDRVMADATAVGVRTLYLEVRESNSAALALYHGAGFRAMGRRPGYYRHPPEDALVLRRDLAPT